MNQEQITPEQRAEKRFPEIANTLNADRGDLYYLEQIPENFWTDGEKVRHGELQNEFVRRLRNLVYKQNDQ